jgi:hypothetical protein
MWVTGYLSGLNMESSPDFLRDRDADGLMAWIDNYCRRNPLHTITQAVHALRNELRSRTLTIGRCCFDAPGNGGLPQLPAHPPRSDRSIVTPY